MRKSTVGPKTLMKQLRELMAQDLGAQVRLDRIVQKIARNMVAEVCSLYILRSDGMLELFATHGLNPAAVHHTRLRLGQGLVGTVAATARPLNLNDAQNHPAFAYLPEIREELYSSFLGLPVLRSGRVLGVVVLQNRNQRTYSDDDIEIMETVSMVLAETIAAGDMPQTISAKRDSDQRRPFSLQGTALNGGVGLGHVVLHKPHIVVTRLVAENSADELQKLNGALEKLRQSIDTMLARSDVALDGEHREVLEAYRMFAHDRGWVQRLEEAVKNGLTAEAAVEKVQSDTRTRMLQITDPYLRERLSDLDDLANRLLAGLMGKQHETVTTDLPENTILVADSMGAAELLDYPRQKIRGLVLEDGATTSHVTIVARALGIPVIGQAKGVTSLSVNGDAIVIDGDEGRVHLRPLASVEHAYAEKARFQAQRQKAYDDLRQRPAVTRDNVPITMLINAGLLVDLPQLEKSGAEGIGLFRTELQFMIASTFPRAEKQEQLYRAVYQEIGDKTVTFRTLDIGGDKMLPYFRPKGKEENPAMGWRAIRLTLDRPALMRTQLRAMLKAAEGRTLRLMIPMVSDISEIHQTRTLIEREKAYLTRFGHTLPSRIKLGAMIEVPALLFQLDELMQAVDFISVGSNDLFQFLMAVDRGNSALTNRFDQLSPTFLRALRDIARAGERHDTPVTLCGEMAGIPLCAMALIGLGFRRISMSPAAIGPVKAMLLSLDVGKLSAFLNSTLEKPCTGYSLHRQLLEFAQNNAISL